MPDSYIIAISYREGLMVLHFVAVACLLVGAVSAPVLAQDAAPTAATNVPPVKPHKVCRHEEQMNSNIPKTTCHTQPEWDAIDKANISNVTQLRQSGALNGH